MVTGDGSADTSTLDVTAAPAAAPDAWGERMNAFAIATAKTREWIENALRGLVGEPGGPGALEALSDSTAVHDTDLEKVLVGAEGVIPLGIFRKNLSKLRGPQPLAASPAVSDAVSYDVLPTVPEDASFLEMLKVGGVLKPAKTEVIAAIKAALANRLGLFDLPGLISERMEAWAEDQEEPVGESLFVLRKLVITRKYAEVLSAMGADGSFITDTRRNTFLQRVDEYLWTEVRGFYGVLKSWQDSWLAGMNNPGMMLGMLAMGQLGSGAAMPPGMVMQPPDTAPVRDAAEGVIDKTNRVFAGYGIVVARALAYDATRIKAVLEEPTLPSSIGATNREQMLKMLNVSVAADYVRLEQSLARFVLALMELPRVSSGPGEQVYLGAMLQLGTTIPWDKLPDGTEGKAGLRTRRNGGA